MAQIKKQYADDERTSLLRKTIETATSDKQQNNHYISDATLEAAKAFLPGWTSGVTVLQTFLSNRSREVREKNEAIGLPALNGIWCLTKSVLLPQQAIWYMLNRPGG
ncbi:MAG: hypothetical protein ACOCXS_02125 [Bacteroidota bacterium]